ncbi:MAG: flagellar basal body P-ring protein FlgI [Terriglobia bacterium]
MRSKLWVGVLGLQMLLLPPTLAGRESAPRKVRLGDVSTVEGVRDNLLIGYGMVVGLNGTGDRQQTVFSVQTLANLLQKMGVQFTASAVVVKNVAGVFVTATLPPFSRPGTPIDVTVSSIGDAKSLEGGLLLFTTLHGPDGQVYATAQGPLANGGYTVGGRGNSVQVNHPTTARIPAGGIVERDAAMDLSHLTRLSLLLRDPDFQTATEAAAVIEAELGKGSAWAVDSRRIEIQVPAQSLVSGLLAKVEDLRVAIHPQAKVIVNERTGTIVMGQEVSLGACSILHGNLSVVITTEFKVSQPLPYSQGQTQVVPQTTVKATESPARRIELPEGARVDDLINGLQAIGATPRDIVAIMEALRAAGALQAELEII